MSKYRILLIESGEYLYTDKWDNQIYAYRELSNMSEPSCFMLYETDSKKKALKWFADLGSRNSIKLADANYISLYECPNMFEIVKVLE